FFNAKRSRLLRGKQRNKLIRRSRAMNASRNAFSISLALPFTAAGSGTPQCAVIGCPGQTGHTSFAALSQTVKTKSSFGEPGCANSSHDLLRQPVGGSFASWSCSNASRRTAQLGWLPALKAVKLGLPLCFKIASAMMERAEFPVQRNRTL